MTEKEIFEMLMNGCLDEIKKSHEVVKAVEAEFDKLENARVFMTAVCTSIDYWASKHGYDSVELAKVMSETIEAVNNECGRM